MLDAKLKHLEMIQAVINRMGMNSFQIKGWSVLLVTGLFVLAGAKDSMSLAALAIMPALVFWGLDGYYLWQERLFRDLYKSVAKIAPDAIDFDMNTKPFREKDTWWRATASLSVLPFHGAILVAILIVTVWPKIHHFWE